MLVYPDKKCPISLSYLICHKCYKDQSGFCVLSFTGILVYFYMHSLSIKSKISSCQKEHINVIWLLQDSVVETLVYHTKIYNWQIGV